MYNANPVDRERRESAVMKRRSTRHVSEVTAIASQFGNSAKIILPRSWLGRKVIAFLHSEYISKHPDEQRKDE
jgi:putative transposon-encoded protein